MERRSFSIASNKIIYCYNTFAIAQWHPTTIEAGNGWVWPSVPSESSSKEARIIMEHEYRKCMETVFICPRWEVVVFLNLLPLNWVFRAHSHNLAFGISNSEVSPNGSVWKMYNRHVSDCLSCDQQFQLARGCNCIVHDGNELQLALPASVLLLWSEAVLNLLILWAKVKKSCFRAVENQA